VREELHDVQDGRDGHRVPRKFELSVIAFGDDGAYRLHAMELRQLTTFVAVAEAGGFTRAAERLHVVQSAVSAGVRTLERELGTPLFERTTHRVELTDAGRALLPEARATLAAARAAREAVDEVRGGLRGTVSLGVMQAQAMRAFDVASLLADFRADHPAVELRVRQGPSAEIAEHVRDGTMDLAFLAAPDRRPAGLELTPVDRTPMSLVVDPGHRLAGRADVELSAIVDETFADGPEGWGTRMAVDRAFAAAGLRRHVTYEVNDTATIVDFAAHGLAVAILPETFTTSDDDIVHVPIRHHVPWFKVAIAEPSTRRLGPAAAALLAAAKQRQSSVRISSRWARRVRPSDS
jgi:DNA-binding transcriptional LysR family regulator